MVVVVVTDFMSYFSSRKDTLLISSVGWRGGGDGG